MTKPANPARTGRPQPRPVRWVGSSREDLVGFPEEARRRVGIALWEARLAGVVYVLHAFQKKSKRGRATPKAELDLIGRRLKRAKEDYEQWQGARKTSR